VDELLGRNAHDLLHYARPDGTPFPWEQCPTRAVMAEGRTVRASGEVYWRKDGSPFAIELTVTPLYEQGRLVGAVNTLRDVTDRLRAEESLRESEERFRTLSMWSPIGIYQTDASGQTQYVNPRWQEISGLTLEQSLGYGWASRIHPDDRQAVFASWDRAVAARAEFSMEFRLLHPSGQTRWVHSRGAPVLGEDGELNGYAGAVEDLTERKRWEAEIAEALAVQRQANEQLERLNRAKSNFVSVVSHEFRTPLTGIQGFSELMRDGDFSLEEMKEFSADINREAERLGRMITDVLDLDRMESGRMSVHLEQVDLNALAAEIAEHSGRTAPAHRLRLEPDPALPALTGDRDKLTQVLVNLIGNAIKYSPDGGVVTVGTRREAAEAHLFVRDQGIGLPPEALEAVFERYARVESGPHRYVKGTGLGLPIVREIARLHGGRVWAESEPGQGSTFHLVLPLAGPPTGE
jgi:PAS domain S-box-containing protein